MKKISIEFNNTNEYHKLSVQQKYADKTHSIIYSISTKFKEN